MLLMIIIMMIIMIIMMMIIIMITPGNDKCKHRANKSKNDLAA